MSHAYATANALAGLAPSAFTWSTAGTTNRNYLTDGTMGKVADSGGSASVTSLFIDLGVATNMVGFALLNHSMSTWTAPVLEVAGADDLAFTTGVVVPKNPTTPNQVAPNQKDMVLLFPALSKRYWRLRFSDSVARTFSLGEVFGIAAAGLTTLTRVKTYGHGETEEYLLNTSMSKTGERRDTFLAGPIRTKHLPFSDARGTEKAELMAMWRACRGGALPLLWVEFITSFTANAASAAEQECVFGKLQPSFSWTENDYNLFTVTSLELRSLGREVGA